MHCRWIDLCLKSATIMFGSNQNEATTKSSATENYKSKVAWSNDSKKPIKRTGYRTIMKDFLQNTSLHGLKYIGYTRFTIFER